MFKRAHIHMSVVAVLLALSCAFPAFAASTGPNDTFPLFDRGSFLEVICADIIDSCNEIFKTSAEASNKTPISFYGGYFSDIDAAVYMWDVPMSSSYIDELTPDEIAHYSDLFSRLSDYFYTSTADMTSTLQSGLDKLIEPGLLDVNVLFICYSSDGHALYASLNEKDITDYVTAGFSRLT